MSCDLRGRILIGGVKISLGGPCRPVPSRAMVARTRVVSLAGGPVSAHGEVAWARGSCATVSACCFLAHDFYGWKWLPSRKRFVVFFDGWKWFFFFLEFFFLRVFCRFVSGKVGSCGTVMRKCEETVGHAVLHVTEQCVKEMKKEKRALFFFFFFFLQCMLLRSQSFE